MLETVTGFVHDGVMAESGSTKRWAGLLRAVNVGGRRLSMAALKKSAIDAGFTDVSTLLASGNVAFTAAGAQATVRKKIEQAISDDAGFRVEVLLRSKQQLDTLLAENPFPDGKGPQVLVCFLDGAPPAGLAERLAEVAVNERIEVGTHEVWIDFCDGIGRSKLAVALPKLCKPIVVTGRNVNTVGKLVKML
jgi:uncharacterized protein (DUF1697 family)